MPDETPEEPAPTIVAAKDPPIAPSRLPWFAVGVGSAALVAALLYATRSKHRDWSK